MPASFSPRFLFILLSLRCLAMPVHSETASAPTPSIVFAEDFEQFAGPLPEGWSAEGDATVREGDAFHGSRSLTLRKTEATLRDRVIAQGPRFAVEDGMLAVSFATRSELTSMDNSYNGTLVIEFFEADGKSSGAHELGAWFRRNPWQRAAVRLRVPDGSVSARLVATINKETPGVFAVDALSVEKVAGVADDGLRRMMFTLPRLGHLLYPDDARTAEIEVWSAKELPDELRTASFVVSDYWGAEQNRAIRLELKPAGKVKGRIHHKYTGTLDLSAVPLEIGRYYELHGEIARREAEAFSNHTSFAILPEAEANRHRPEDVPFTSRTWDQRFRESPLLSHRLGIRVCNAWGEMTADPARVAAAQIELSHELGLGVIVRSFAERVEKRVPGWEKLLADDGEFLRQGVRNFMAKYGHIRPMFVVLGNEPHSKGEDVKIDVEAYRVVYQEVKKFDPTITVIASSLGLDEAYFKAGFGQWCDVYNFHSYEAPEGVRTIVEKRYPAMFAKYGHAKPVWSTELGMNSQGMERLAVAGLLHRKFANFFAGGGANASWFGLFYPDEEGTRHNSFASAHNVFDSRYNKYAPKLDAVALYNAVNGVAVKRFVGDAVYPDGSRLFLFADDEGRSLIVAYKDKGRGDVLLPLSGATTAEVIRIDGSRDRVAVADGGLDLTIDEEPVLILYEHGPSALPATLAGGRVAFAEAPGLIRREGGSAIEVLLPEGVAPEAIELQAPPFWEVVREPGVDVAPDGSRRIRFSLGASAESRLREAALTLRRRDASGNTIATLLSLRIPVEDWVSFELQPVAFGEEGGPGARIVIRNNDSRPRDLTWEAELLGEQHLVAGRFTGMGEAEARFAVPASGALTVAGRETTEIVLPLAGVRPITVYHLKAGFRDESGRVVTVERPLAGFVPVPRAGGPVTIDGRLDDEAWTRARVERLDKAEQFYGFKFAGKEVPVWSGVEDLSADIRYLWDDDYLYVGIEVRDDIVGGTSYADSYLWQMDSVQFLVDPARSAARKPGKYEYALARGAKGVQVWCALTADAGVPAGLVEDFQVAIHPAGNGTGDATYEVAIPWSRLAPFKPEHGANLGFTLIVNDDDGEGRNAFMTWFGNAHTKDIDTVGDLILLE